MRVLLSDGAGLTSRQSATLLSLAGHHVEALSPEPLCLCRFTRRVRRVNRVPTYGVDPFAWLDAALDVAGRRHIDLLLPTQEHVAVMALAADRLRAAGLLSPLPDFSALAQVQSKLAAFATLTRVGLPQPRAEIATTRRALEASGMLPSYVKVPIGTASTGVHKVTTTVQLGRLAARYEREGVFRSGGVLLQRPVHGPLVMVQSVFARGDLIAFHACERVREGAGGGASHKRGLELPEVAEHMNALGRDLGWHGALSADVILGPDGPYFIDINPRLVEPVNAHLSGVDLLGAMIDIARTGTARPRSHPFAEGVRTHQLLLAVLGAAQHRGRRRDIAGELWAAATRHGDYRASAEELTPSRADPLSPLPVVIAALATLVSPAAWQLFTGSSVGAYALTPAAWERITAARPPGRGRITTDRG